MNSKTVTGGPFPGLVAVRKVLAKGRPAHFWKTVRGLMDHISHFHKLNLSIFTLSQTSSLIFFLLQNSPAIFLAISRSGRHFSLCTVSAFEGATTWGIFSGKGARTDGGLWTRA